MKVNLLPMPFIQARELAEYCVEHDIDSHNAQQILASFTKRGSYLTVDEWALTVPDSVLTYFALMRPGWETHESKVS
jgi:hypothetical protein